MKGGVGGGGQGYVLLRRQGLIVNVYQTRQTFSASKTRGGGGLT